MKNSLNAILGLTAGIINCIAWYLISRRLTYYEVAAVENYNTVVMLILLFIGISVCLFFKRRSNNGFLPFKEAFRTGLLYAFILSLILAIFSYIYYKFIAPDAIEFYISEAKKYLPATEVTPDKIPLLEERIKKIFSPFKTLMTSFIWGLVVSLITSGIFQKKAPVLPYSEN